MKISSLNSFQRSVVRNSDGLRNYLTNLEYGREETPHSWIYEKEDSMRTLKKWMLILERELPKFKEGELIYQFELKQVEKFGPQGEVPPIKEAIKVESFVDQYLQNKEVSMPLRPLSSILKKSQLQYWDLAKVYDSMSSRDTLESNSGWPEFRVRKYVRKTEERYAMTGAWKDFPAIILFRKYNGKLRVVWMYPMSANLREYMATIPIQNYIKDSTKYVTPWLGFENVKSRFTQLWHSHKYAFGGDTTAMDAHMQHSQLQVVNDMCADLFADSTIMSETLQHVSHIDLVVGIDSIIRDQIHGIASGSGWTQLSETIFQIGMFDQYIKENNLSLTVDDGMGIGDDYVWFFDDKQESEQIVSFWEKQGLPGKPEKQSNEEDSCTFLQRLFIKDFWSRDDSKVLGGIYPTIRALNSILNPEKTFNKNKFRKLGLKVSDYMCSRTFMILENCVDHPLFPEFCKFIVAGYKDLLTFAKDSERKMNDKFSQLRKLPGVNPSYNQEKLTKPLSEFSSIKLVRSL